MPLSDRRVLRPFYPGGDYENYEYHMDVDFDFSDVDSFFDEGEWEVEKR